MDRIRNDAIPNFAWALVSSYSKAWTQSEAHGPMVAWYGRAKKIQSHHIPSWVSIWFWLSGIPKLSRFPKPSGCLLLLHLPTFKGHTASAMARASVRGNWPRSAEHGAEQGIARVSQQGDDGSHEAVDVPGMGSDAETGGTDLAFDPTPASHSTLLHKNQKPRHIRPYPTKNKQPFQGKNNITRVTFDPTSFQVS